MFMKVTAWAIIKNHMLSALFSGMILKTLTDKNIDKVMNNLIRAFEKELNAHIR